MSHDSDLLELAGAAERARIEQARAELGVTAVAPTLARGLVAAVVVLCLSVTAFDLASSETRRQWRDFHRRLAEITASWDGKDLAAYKPRHRFFAIAVRVRRQLDGLEANLQEASTTQRLRPWVQRALTALGAGNEWVYVGRDGWLFYRFGLESVTGLPFRDRPDQPPAHAIVDFRDQLRRRGIELVVLPVPVKASLHPDALKPGVSPPVFNPAWPTFLKTLRAASIRVLDPTSTLLAERQAGRACFLPRDTHWSGPAVQAVARALAGAIRPDLALPTAPTVRLPLPIVDVEGFGDLERMLDLPGARHSAAEFRDGRRDQALNAAMVETDLPPADDDAPSPVLLLGDSFSAVHSIAEMGWGAGAGLGEHLAAELGVGVSRIVRNGFGAYASREGLRQALASGDDRLAGVKVVVWEFSALELSIGEWRRADLPDVVPPPTRLAGEVRPVSGRIVSVTAVPAPRSQPYANVLMSLVVEEDGGEQLLVYTWGMRNDVWTDMARLTSGSIVRAELTPWAAVVDRLGSTQRLEPDGDAVLLEPYWAESVRAVP